jgi:hypothetical protein
VFPNKRCNRTIDNPNYLEGMYWIEILIEEEETKDAIGK